MRTKRSPISPGRPRLFTCQQRSRSLTLGDRASPDSSLIGATLLQPRKPGPSGTSSALGDPLCKRHPPPSTGTAIPATQSTSRPHSGAVGPLSTPIEQPRRCYAPRAITVQMNDRSADLHSVQEGIEAHNSFWYWTCDAVSAMRTFSAFLWYTHCADPQKLARAVLSRAFSG